MTREYYKGYYISEGDYTPFDFVHDEYDGPDDHRLGTGKSIEDCKEQIDEQLDSEPITLDEADVRYIKASQKWGEIHGDTGL